MGDDKTRGGIVPISASAIGRMIHVVRGRQVMLDSDLAELYGVETGQLNRAAARNKGRFPEDFRFRLAKEELEALRCQIGISNESRGGRRYLPYAYTEQGIAMLSSVLRSETAVWVSVQIMRAFVEMRRFLAANAQVFERVRELDARQRIDQARNDGRFEKIFGCLEAREEPAQHLFFQGQMYDAFELLARLVGSAERSVVLVDGYVGLGTLNVLAKKRPGVAATVWASRRGDRLTAADVEKFNEQYPTLEVRHTEAFHDRYLILDGEVGYHVGASVKDAGRKAFGIDRLGDLALVEAVLSQLRG